MIDLFKRFYFIFGQFLNDCRLCYNVLDAHFLTWTYFSTLVDNTVTAPSNDFTFKVFIRAYNFPG